MSNVAPSSSVAARGLESDVARSLTRFPLFAGLPPAALLSLETLPVHALAPGALLVREGDRSTSLFCLVSGQLEVTKRVHGGAAQHRIHTLSPGEPVGEVSFFDRLPRSASVSALEPSVVVELPYERVAATPALVNRLGERLADRLRTSSVDEAEGAHQRIAMGMLVVKVITLLCGYALLLAVLPRFELGAANTTYLSLPMIAAFGVGAWRFIRATRTPLAYFGLGLRSFVTSLLESALLTPVFCALLVGLKWIALRVHEPWHGYPLFERTSWADVMSRPNITTLLVVYLVSSAVQELIVRSALQASLEEFLVGANAKRTTLFVCALMFSMNHLHMSFVFAAAAFVPGLFWGWLFARRRNLVGPVLSHFVVGAFVFFVLGVSLP